jgi:hypothetical protein
MDKNATTLRADQAIETIEFIPTSPRSAASNKSLKWPNGL